MKVTLREKCPNKEFFLVRNFPHSDQKKLRIWTLSTQCKTQTHFKLKFIFTIYPHGCITRSWRCNPE